MANRKKVRRTENWDSVVLLSLTEIADEVHAFFFQEPRNLPVGLLRKCAELSELPFRFA